MFNIFLSPFNWKVFSFDAVASVGCSASRLQKSLETQTDWKTCSFHFFGMFACFQKRSSFFKTGMVREILREISSPGSTRFAISVLGMWFCPDFSKACHLGKLFCCFYWMRCMCICLCSASFYNIPIHLQPFHLVQGLYLSSMNSQSAELLLL